MVMKSIGFPILYFVVSIVWQLIFYQEVKWIDNIGVCFIMFLLFLVYHYGKMRNQSKKDNDGK